LTHVPPSIESYTLSLHDALPISLAAAKAARAVLMGAVGGPKWRDAPRHKRPEAGLLALREGMNVYANLRPAICFDALADASSLRSEEHTSELQSRENLVCRLLLE